MTTYAAFISYSHDDAAFASELQRKLEKFRIPRSTARQLGRRSNRLGPVFRDVSDLGAATQLNEALRKQLEQSAALIVVCSASAARSHWVEQEILAFRLAHGEGARILPIVAPDAGTEAAENLFPPALGTEPPLAADARPGADGQRAALLKLIAGLLDTGLDDLVRRDARRRQQRLVTGLVLTTLLALSMTVLAVMAVSSREDAHRRLSQSEDLINFMLGDLRNQLTPLGQVKVLQSVGDKALAYFESLEDADLTEAALLRKSRALYQLGEVYFELGAFSDAQKSFQLSLAQTRALAAAEPEDQDRLFELSQSEFWAGYAAWNEGDLAQAEEHMQAYHDAAWRLHDADPANPDWVMETFWASNNLGSLALSGRRYESAERHFQAALERIQLLLGEDPDEDLLLEYSATLNWLGTANYHLGSLAESRSAFQRALATPLDPDNALHQEERAFQLGFLAEVELHLGDLSTALALATEAADTLRGLSETDPESMKLLYGRTFLEEIAARVRFHGRLPFEFSHLRDNAQRLLGTKDAPPSWRRLALRVAGLGIRSEAPGARTWATTLLDEGPAAGGSDDALKREHLDVALALAADGRQGTELLRRVAPAFESQFRAANDFDLALPLARTHEALSNDDALAAMNRVLDQAGSSHPDRPRQERQD